MSSGRGFVDGSLWPGNECVSKWIYVGKARRRYVSLHSGWLDGVRRDEAATSGR